MHISALGEYILDRMGYVFWFLYNLKKWFVSSDLYIMSFNKY